MTRGVSSLIARPENWSAMAILLSIVAAVALILIVGSVSRWVYKEGGILLSVVVTIFLGLFGIVSLQEASLTALNSALSELVLCVFLVADAILIRFARA